MTEVEAKLPIERSAQPSTEARPIDDSAFLRKLRDRTLETRDPTIELVYRCLLEQFEAMLDSEPIARAGCDLEGVHQMRVATRRIRAALRAFKSVLKSVSRNEFRREFKWLASVLGGVRDLDVYQDNLRDYMDEIPVEETACLDDYQRHLATQWQTARNVLVDCLSGERYRTLKSSFNEFLQRGPSTDEFMTESVATIRDTALRLVGKQFKSVRRRGRSITPESPREELHALRIDCKRLRYLFEFFREIYGSSLNPFIKRLEALQDVLGEYQDTQVATEQLLQHATRVPMQAENRCQLLALGQLIASQRRHAAHCRVRFHKVWKRFDRRGTRSRLLAVLN